MSKILTETLNNLCFTSSNKFYSVELCSLKSLNLDSLSLIKPDFYSVTWHYQTIKSKDDVLKHPAMILAIKLIADGKNVLLHLPCRYLNKQNVVDILTIASENNIKNIFAMLGESIKSQQPSNDFTYAYDLIKFIKNKFGCTFSICVAGYPQGHPESVSYEKDLLFLKQKIDAGADFIITQVVFDIKTFHKFYKNCRELEINVPIIPGIYLINSYSTVLTMAKICHVVIPDNVSNFLKSIKDDKKAMENYGKQLIISLLSNHDYPICGIHIFSLNNIDLVHNLTTNIEHL